MLKLVLHRKSLAVLGALGLVCLLLFLTTETRGQTGRSTGFLD
jgi:hypothetical protein